MLALSTYMAGLPKRKWLLWWLSFNKPKNNAWNKTNCNFLKRRLKTRKVGHMDLLLHHQFNPAHNLLKSNNSPSITPLETDEWEWLRDIHLKLISLYFLKTSKNTIASTTIKSLHHAFDSLRNLWITFQIRQNSFHHELLGIFILMNFIVRFHTIQQHFMLLLVTTAKRQKL